MRASEISKITNDARRIQSLIRFGEVFNWYDRRWYSANQPIGEGDYRREGGNIRERIEALEKTVNQLTANYNHLYKFTLRLFEDNNLVINIEGDNDTKTT